MSERVPFGLVGTGWRARFFARVARLASERFELTGIVSRAAGPGAQVWGFPAYPSVDELLSAAPASFVVVSVPWSAAAAATSELVQRHVPVLSETPPAPDLDGLLGITALAASSPVPIQVAEQYPYQPLHAARIAMTDAGVLGPVHEAYLSVAHGYHGFALMRRHLGVGAEAATILATATVASTQSTSPRSGPRRERGYVDSTRTHALVDFGGRTGIYDFSDTQYWSYAHRHHVILRGRDGELADEEWHRVRGADETASVLLRREMTGVGGNMAGNHVRGISAGDRWWWRNPFPGARFFDDEIAVATTMELMARHVAGGPPFYGVADAAQDHYLGLVMQEAIASGGRAATTRQPWAEQLIDAGQQPPIPLPVIEDVGPWSVPPSADHR